MGFTIPIRQDSGTLVADRAPGPRELALVEVRTSEATQTFLVVGLSAILIFAVLAFGCTDPWAIAAMEVGSALLLLSWIWPQITSGHLEIRANSLWAPMVLFALLVGAQVVFGLSAYVHITRVELLKYAAYGSMFLIATQLERTAAQRFLTILGAFGFIVAFFALIQDLTYNGKIYWFWPSVPSTFGPYANYDHYAGLMELLAPIALSLGLIGGPKRAMQLLWTVGGILMAATIFICGSGGGMIAFMVEMLFLGGFILARRNRRTAWALLVLFVLTGSLALWIDDGRMLRKLGSFWEPPLTNSDVNTRLAISRDALRMIYDRAIAGWGLGVFPVVYPQYRSFSTDLFVNQAHNDYIQELVETGTLGFACVIWFIVSLYRSSFKKLKAHSKFAIARTLGPVVGCTGILVHSLSDFNLHIPANAALFFVLCGLASGHQSQ